MKKLLLLVVLALAIPSMALATHIVNLEGQADCDVWLGKFDVVWRSTAMVHDVTLDYRVVLTDAHGIEVAVFEDVVEMVPPVGAYYSSHQIGEAWNLDLAGEYTVTGSLYMYAPYGDAGLVDEGTSTFETGFTCEPPANRCNFTPGFWKNHPEDWPVDSLVLGGVTYTQDEAMVVLNTPVRGDATIILSYHLIAAKLNVANGSDSSINDTIFAADDLLASLGGIGTRPKRSPRGAALLFKDTMADYNEMGCDESMDGDLEKAAGTMTEETSWGSLKSMYR